MYQMTYEALELELNEKEVEAISLWVGPQHEAIVESIKEGGERGKNWFSGVLKLPKFDGVVFRGLCVNEEHGVDEKKNYLSKLASLSVGENVPFERPASASSSRNMADDFSLPSEESQQDSHLSVLLIMRVKNGRKITDKFAHSHGDESEIIILPNVNFKVTQVSKDIHEKQSRTIIEIEEIAP